MARHVRKVYLSIKKGPGPGWSAVPGSAGPFGTTASFGPECGPGGPV